MKPHLLPTCPQLIQEYNFITKLKKRLESAFQEGIEKKNFIFTKRLKKEMEKKKKELRELQNQLPVSIEQAKALMDSLEDKENNITNVLGPKEVGRVLGVTLKKENIPPIPFSMQELKRAGRLRQKLIFRVPCTFAELTELMKQKADTEEVRSTGGIGYIFETLRLFYRSIEKAEKPEWVLVSGEPIKRTYGKTEVLQLKLLSDYIENVVYKDQSLPLKYQEPLAQFKKEYKELIMKIGKITEQQFNVLSDEEANKLIFNNANKVMGEKGHVKWLTNQSIIQLITPTPVGWYYDFCVRYLFAVTSEQKKLLYKEYKNYTRLFNNILFTNSMVYAGGLDERGVKEINLIQVGTYQNNLGVVLSRT